jgi:hypothetical protein
MQLATFLKNVRRQARLELRLGRLELVTARAEDAKDTDLVAKYDKEGKRRLAEIHYLETRNEADLEDNPDWKAHHDGIREAVLAGARGSKKAKAIMGAVLKSGAAPAQAAAEAEVATE